MYFRIDEFKGAVPRVDPKLLPKGYAQTAENVDLRTGKLKALNGLTEVQAIAKTGAIRSIYKIDGTWISWTAIVEVVKAQLADSDHRILFTGDGYPKQTDKTKATSGAASTYPTTTRRLGINAPVAALTPGDGAGVQGSGDGSVTDTVSYVYTLVDEFGAESAPSPATVAQDVEGGQYIRLQNFVIPSLASTGNDIKYFRLYRLNAGTTGAEYQLVKARPVNLSADPVYDIPVSSVSSASVWVYDADDGVTPTGLNDDLSEVIPTESWDNPPDDLEGLVQFQNGILAGFDGNELYISEPMIYYAFPAGGGDDDYVLTTDYDIVALGVYGEALIIATEAFPYIAIGNDPATMALRVLPYAQACLSKRGLVSADAGVIYPSPDGLFMLTSSEGSVVTKGVYTKSQWAALTPASLISFYYDEKYFGFFSGTGTGIVVNFKEDSHVSTITLPAGNTIYGGYQDPEDDTLYLLIKDASDAYHVKSWETGSALTYTWKSGVYETPEPVNFGWARVVGDYTGGKSVTVKLYGDGTLRSTKTVTSSDWFRLPAGYMAREHEIQLEGTMDVDSIIVAEAREEV